MRQTFSGWELAGYVEVEVSSKEDDVGKEGGNLEDPGGSRIRPQYWHEAIGKIEWILPGLDLSFPQRLLWKSDPAGTVFPAAAEDPGKIKFNKFS